MWTFNPRHAQILPEKPPCFGICGSVCSGGAFPHLVSRPCPRHSARLLGLAASSGKLSFILQGRIHSSALCIFVYAALVAWNTLLVVISLCFKTQLQNDPSCEVFADSPDGTGHAPLHAPTWQPPVVSPVTLDCELFEDRGCDSLYRSSALTKFWLNAWMNAFITAQCN